MLTSPWQDKSIILLYNLCEAAATAMYILHTFWAKDRILDGFSIYVYIVNTYVVWCFWALADIWNNQSEENIMNLTATIYDLMRPINWGTVHIV